MAENIEQFEDEQIIDFAAIFRKLLRGWKQILIITVIFSVLGVAYAMKMKRTYTVSMILAPELQNRSSSGLSQLASMLGGGISMSSSPDALNITMFPEISSSTPFLCSLLDVPVTPFVPKKLELEGVKPDTTTVFLHMIKRDIPVSGRKAKKREEADAKYLYDDSVINPDYLTPRQFVAVKALRRAIDTNVDNKTGVTTINVVLDDPMIVKQLADTVCQRLQDFVTDYRTKKATADYQYYVELADDARRKLVRAQAAYSARVDYDRSVILQSVNSERQRLESEVNLANQIYSQMAQQRELAKAKIQEVKPVYAVMQPATVPLRPSNSRSRVCIAFFFVGFLLSVVWVAFFKDLFKKAKEDLKKEDD